MTVICYREWCGDKYLAVETMEFYNIQEVKWGRHESNTRTSKKFPWQSLNPPQLQVKFVSDGYTISNQKKYLDFFQTMNGCNCTLLRDSKGRLGDIVSLQGHSKVDDILEYVMIV